MNPESQLQAFADQQEIQNCIINYCYYFDTNQPTKIVELFAEDANVDYGPEVKISTGHVEIFAAISKGLKDTFAATSHHVSNFKIEIVHQQSATLSCYLYAWHRYKSTDVIGHLWGQYHLELIKTIGGWKISNLVLKGTATQDFHRTSMHSIGRLP